MTTDQPPAINPAATPPVSIPSDNRSAGPAPAAPTRRQWLALVVLMAGAFISLLDTTIVNVALQSIRESLNANEAALEWVISGYALAFGLTLIPAGRVGDRYGHKWVFVAGLSLFTIASLACGLAQDSFQLIVARVVQGAAGGIYFPAVTAIIRIMFRGPAIGKAFGVLGAVLGFSAALGPIVGGVIIQLAGEELGWRLVFAVNLPIGIVAVIAAIILLPTGTPTRSAAKVDYFGVLLLSAGLVGILVPLIEGQTEGWPLWTYLVLVAGVLLLVAFAFWERHQAKLDRNPIVPPHLFSHPAFTGGVILATVYFAGFTSIFFVITLLWQGGLGASALDAGLVGVPFAIGTIVGASNSDRLARRLGRGVLILGVGLLTLGLASAWVVLEIAATDVTNWMLLVPLALAGIGSGFFIAPNTEFIVATVDRSEAGAAAGVLGTAQRVGSAIGIAVVGSVLFGTLEFGQGPDAAAVAFTTSAQYALLVSVGLAFVAFLLTFTLPRRLESSAHA